MVYSLSQLKLALSQPRLAIAEFNRLVANGPGFRATPEANEDGIDMLAADWDTLILLDACRYDTFAELATDLPGTLEKVESTATATTEFLQSQFGNEQLHDTVYVTANPQLYRAENGISGADPVNCEFHAQLEVWQDNWDDDYRTVMPDVVTEAALEAAEEYPQKRLIVHYLQPHAPYIGPTGDQFPADTKAVWRAYRRGEFDVSLAAMRQAYRENLEAVLPHVAALLSKREGRTVVTADHGELLGERDFPIPIRRFGHPPYTNLPALVEVPWLVHEHGTRPKIVPEAPAPGEHTNLDSDVVKERLGDLGYVE